MFEDDIMLEDDFAKRVLFTINKRVHWHAIENELDRVFRSPHFNLSQRKNDQNLKGASQGAQSYKELYDKRQGQDGFGQAHRPHRSSIHQALQMRSPIISEIFPTPEERFEREKLRKDQVEAQAAEDAVFDAEGGSVAHVFGEISAYDASSRQPVRNAMSRDSYGAQPKMRDGEDAMERMVQDASAAFNEVAGT